MKRSLLLLGLLPAVVLANAIRQAEPPSAKGAKVATPARAAKTAKERWQNVEKADEASFRRHVIPLMSRSGCSGRECHGSFQGRGGFQLSLFGYDFEKDHEAITKGKGGAEEVRVDLTEPMKSLVLAKPSLDGEEHKGKKRFDKGSWEYNLILKWIQSGAKSDVAETGDFTRLDVSPKELVFKKAGDAIQLKVLAHWKDGTVEDVTQLTRFRTNDEAVALVNDTGLVTANTPGDTHIVAFYDNGVEPVPAVLPVSDRVGAKFPAVKTRTKVDELVIAKLRKTGILPSEVCTDLEFLRRASLDVTGTLPTPKEIEAFAKDTAADKRARKVDELLARPAYAAWWTTKLCDFTGNNPRQIRNLLQGGGRNLNEEVSRQWYDWLYARVAENTPYDQLATGIVLATSRTSPEQSYEAMAREMSGYFKKVQPADFSKRATLPWFWARQNLQKSEDKAMAFAHTFLGVRIECAQCHKHPFDQWTKTDFEQFQAFFAPVVTGERREKVDAPGVMNARTLKREIDDKVKAAAENAKPTKEKPTPVKQTLIALCAARAACGDPLAFFPLAKSPEEKRKEAERLAKLAQEQQKRGQGETDRRLAAGEPVPWAELYVDIKRTVEKPRDKKQDVRGSSRVITPKLLGGGEVALSSFPDPRQPLMDWLKAKENPYFAKAFVNRVWASYFSRGIVEPADDLNLANAPSNAELFDFLSDGFVAHNFDMKWLHREILNSDTYQRSWKTNPTNKLDEKNFSHAVIRRLPAEVVFDAIAMATASTERAERFPVEITGRTIGPNTISSTPGNGNSKVGGDSYALTIFGKPAREMNCDCERTTDPTLLQTIFTRNDPSMLQRLDGTGRSSWLDEIRPRIAPSAEQDPEALRKKLAQLEEKASPSLKPPEKPAEGDTEAASRHEEKVRKYEARLAEFNARKAELQKLIVQAEKPRKPFNLDETIAEIFLRTLSRPPSAAELTQARADVAAAKTPLEGVRDLLWAALNTREFMVNH